jgi:hypothetical protein
MPAKDKANPKDQMNFRASEATRRRLEDLRDKWRVNQTEAIEQAVLIAWMLECVPRKLVELRLD